MFQPTVHFVSGFLGSGKTTAIVGACRSLMAGGVRTAIVTNDQGRVQVDREFARAAGVPATAVSNGCLCCRYDDFEQRLTALAEAEHPEVIFAESVGSCADIIATVVKPFAEFRAAHRPRGALTAFVDMRMAEARLSGARLPFSDNVLYIFDKQLEEADLIVANKRDRLPPERVEATVARLEEAYPDARVVPMCALEQPELAAWVELLGTPDSRVSLGRAALSVDYERYAAGEMELAWVDRAFRLEATENGAAPDTLNRIVGALVADLIDRLAGDRVAVGHLKLAVDGSHGALKISWTGADSDRGEALAPLSRALLGERAQVTLNLRAVDRADRLAVLVDAALECAGGTANVAVQAADAFHPGYPRPVHRFG